MRIETSTPYETAGSNRGGINARVDSPDNRRTPALSERPAGPLQRTDILSAAATREGTRASIGARAARLPGANAREVGPSYRHGSQAVRFGIAARLPDANAREIGPSYRHGGRAARCVSPAREDAQSAASAEHWIEVQAQSQAHARSIGGAPSSTPPMLDRLHRAGSGSVYTPSDFAQAPASPGPDSRSTSAANANPRVAARVWRSQQDAQVIHRIDGLISLVRQLAPSSGRSGPGAGSPANGERSPDRQPLLFPSTNREVDAERTPLSATEAADWSRPTAQEVNRLWGAGDATAASPGTGANALFEGHGPRPAAQAGQERADGRPATSLLLPQDDPDETVGVRSKPLSAGRIQTSLKELLGALGASLVCQTRWVDAAMASPVNAGIFLQFFSAFKDLPKRHPGGNDALQSVLSSLLDHIVAEGAQSFEYYAGRAREALGYCGDRTTLGLNSMLVGQLEQDIARGVYDHDPCRLDQVLRSLYRFEALRAAGEEKILRDIRVNEYNELQYKAEPVEVHLALQCKLGERLGLPPIVRSLLFPNYVKFEQNDYDAIEHQVLESERRNYGIYLAAESPHWRQVMSRLDPDGVSSAEATRYHLLENYLESDVQAYCELFPALTREEAAVEVCNDYAWQAYAPLLRECLAPHGLWPLHGAPVNVLERKLEQDIAHGAYDADLRGLDHALRGIYRTEALRAAVEKRFDDDSQGGPTRAPGSKRQAQPLDIHLGLQRRLGLPKPGLPATWMTMISPKLAGLTQADYDAVEQEVRNSESRRFGVYLAAHSPHWRGVMARVDPEGLAAAQAARLTLQEQRFAADIKAYGAAHPGASYDAARGAVDEAHAWQAFAPLMRKHLAPQGLWPLNRAPVQRWIYGFCYQLSARLEAGLMSWR